MAALLRCVATVAERPPLGSRSFLFSGSSCCARREAACAASCTFVSRRRGFVARYAAHVKARAGVGLATPPPVSAQSVASCAARARRGEAGAPRALRVLAPRSTARCATRTSAARAMQQGGAPCQLLRGFVAIAKMFLRATHSTRGWEPRRRRPTAAGCEAPRALSCGESVARGAAWVEREEHSPGDSFNELRRSPAERARCARGRRAWWIREPASA